MIPKIFHLTSKNKELPPMFRKNINRIKELYPEYEIRLYDDNDIMEFIRDKFPDYYQNTIRKMPEFIMIVDTVRYMWMHYYGGIYCDMDIMFLNRFEFDDGVIFVEREWTYPEDKSITDSVHNCWFASTAGHPIWTEILDGIAKNVQALQGKAEKPAPRGRIGRYVEKVLIRLRLRKPHFPMVFNVTGPNAVSRIITQRSLLEKYSDVRVAPGKAIFQGGMSKGLPGDAFFVHETSASWRE